MLKNLRFKILALIFAAIFWVFVVSMENTFYKLPDQVPVHIFNQAEGLAVANEIGTVSLMLRADETVSLKALSVSDFEAYIDLKNAGEGIRNVPVFVTSKNPSVSVLKIEPGEMEIELESVEEKVVSLEASIKGDVAHGYSVKSSRLSAPFATVSGAQSVLKRIANVKAEVKLDGTEDKDQEKTATVKVYDRDGKVLEGIEVKTENIFVFLKIIEIESFKQVGVRADLAGTTDESLTPDSSGAIKNIVVKNVVVNPLVINVKGLKEALSKLEILSTEKIDMKGISASFEKKVKVILPAGVSFAEGEKGEVTVKVEIEK